MATASRPPKRPHRFAPDNIPAPVWWGARRIDHAWSPKDKEDFVAACTEAHARGQMSYSFYARATAPPQAPPRKRRKPADADGVDDILQYCSDPSLPEPPGMNKSLRMMAAAHHRSLAETGQPHSLLPPRKLDVVRPSPLSKPA